MRALVQRVSRCSVAVGGREVSASGSGMLVLLGVKDSDEREDANFLAEKCANLRIFDDAEGSMNLSVREVGGEILLVSQFTLYASTRKGNRPSYSRSAGPEVAIPLYEQFKARLSQDLGKSIQTGEFGADMQVTLVNDGPVTIIIDSRLRE